jgi:hypothetical protein
MVDGVVIVVAFLKLPVDFLKITSSIIQYTLFRFYNCTGIQIMWIFLPAIHQKNQSTNSKHKRKMAAMMSRTLGFFESCTASDPSCLVTMVAHLDPGGDRLHVKKAFEYAVERTCRRHPNLRSLLVATEDELSLCVIPDYKMHPSHIVIVDVNDSSAAGKQNWQEIVHEEANTAFDLNGAIPYWKIILMKESDHDVLLVKFHHCIGDASSGYIIINDILTFYHDYVVDAEAQVAEVCLPVLASVNDMCFPTGRIKSEEEYVDRSVLQLQERRREWSPKMQFSRPDNPDSGGIRKHNILYRDGTAENLTKLLVRCRKEGVTVGAVLAAATYFAVAKMYASFDDTTDEDQSFALDFDFDVNLRNRFATALGNDHVGGYIGMMAFHLAIKPSTTFWGFVKQVKTAMNAGLEEKQHFHYLEVNARLDAMEVSANADNKKETDASEGPLQVLDGKYAKDWNELTTSETEAAIALGYDEKVWDKHGHVQDMNFSNVGRYFFSPTVGKISIEKIYCVGGGWCPTFGSYIFLIPAVKALHFCLVYEASDFNDEVANRFLSLAADLTETVWSLPVGFTLAEYMN